MRNHERSWPSEVVVMTVGALAGVVATAGVLDSRTETASYIHDVTVEARPAVTVKREPTHAPAIRVVPIPAPKATARGTSAEYEPSIEDLLDVVRYGSVASGRVRAVEALARIGVARRDVMGALFIALGTDESPEVRASVVGALWSFGDPVAAEPLAAAALYDSETWIRIQAVRTMAHVGAPGWAIQSLSYVLDHEESEAVRRVARSELRRVAGG